MTLKALDLKTIDGQVLSAIYAAYNTGGDIKHVVQTTDGRKSSAIFFLFSEVSNPVYKLHVEGLLDASKWSTKLEECNPAMIQIVFSEIVYDDDEVINATHISDILCEYESRKAQPPMLPDAQAAEEDSIAELTMSKFVTKHCVVNNELYEIEHINHVTKLVYVRKHWLSQAWSEIVTPEPMSPPPAAPSAVSVANAKDYLSGYNLTDVEFCVDPVEVFMEDMLVHVSYDVVESLLRNRMVRISREYMTRAKQQYQANQQ